MFDSRVIDICVPSWNRIEQTFASFEDVIDDIRVRKVHVVDDCSDEKVWDRLRIMASMRTKLYLYRNSENKNCYFNKRESVSKGKTNFVILLDSDNHIDRSYLDALYAIPDWDSKTVYQPEFAKPHFDFTKYSGLTLSKENVKEYMHTNLETALNACNFFVNREEYLKVFDDSIEPGSSDSIYFAMTWFKNGGKYHITPNLQYDHFISEKNDGHYQTHSHLYRKFHQQVLRQINEL